MSTAAVICDTGALLDYLVATAPDRRAFREAIDRSRARYVPGLVVAEVDYFLRKERPAMRALMRDLARGAFTYAPPAFALLERAIDIDRQISVRGRPSLIALLPRLPPRSSGGRRVSPAPCSSAACRGGTVR